jgi:hypothetical protein
MLCRLSESLKIKVFGLSQWALVTQRRKLNSLDGKIVSCVVDWWTRKTQVSQIRMMSQGNGLHPKCMKNMLHSCYLKPK